MNILFWGLTVSVIGKIMLAAGVLMAHSEIEHEHRIDARVIRSFHRERWLTLAGIFLIVFGYSLEIYFYGFTTSLLTCEGHDCGTAAAVILSQ